MALSTAMIKGILRAMLHPPEQKRKSLSRNVGCLGFFLAFPVGFLAMGLAQGAHFGDAATGFFGLAAGFTPYVLLYILGKKINAKRMKALVKDFREQFPENTEEYETALNLLKSMQSDSKIEKDLLNALGADITFKQPATQPGKQKVVYVQKSDGDAPQAVSDLLKAFGKKPGGFSSHAEMKALFEQLKKQGKGKGTFETVELPGGKGYYQSYKWSSTSSSGDGGKGPAQDSADALLGAFDKDDPPPAAADAPAPALEPESEPEPYGAADERFIPLDPYAPAVETAEDEDSDDDEAPPNGGRTG